MNAYFASVEQQLQPALRGRPVGVVPVIAETTCCIAVSYEAKKFGVKTGTRVREARQLCPQLILAESQTEMYVRFHKEIVKTVGNVVPIEQVHSIDEMACRLTDRQQEVEHAVQLAREAKQAIRTKVGEHLRCSVGLAPNRFLAKVAAGMQKPDGLTVITLSDLPHKLYPLQLDDLPGIGRGMLARLYHYGIRSIEQLCALSESDMRRIWNSVIGARWWHLLRGADLPEIPTQRRTLGHSHVLAPQFRSDEKTRAVMIKLIHKAATRLRRLHYWAGRLSIWIDYLNSRKSWSVWGGLGRCQDTQTMLKVFAELWEYRDRQGIPLRVGITLWKLTKGDCAGASLFVEDRQRLHLAHIVDMINLRFGSNRVYFAAMQEAHGAAPLRIAFTSIPDLLAEDSVYD